MRCHNLDGSRECEASNLLDGCWCPYRYSDLLISGVETIMKKIIATFEKKRMFL